MDIISVVIGFIVFLVVMLFGGGIFWRLQQKKWLAQLEGIRNMQELLFKNLANEALEKNAFQFQRQTRESLATLLEGFQKKVEDLRNEARKGFEDHTKEQSFLKGEIQGLMKNSQSLSQQTERLTNALKGQQKMQGDWGEVILENLLQASGLQKDKDYILQGKNLGMKNASGHTIRPDAVVKLPDCKHVIIDAKVTLVSYEEYVNAPTEDLKAGALQRFISSVKGHIDGLAGRQYTDILEGSTLDFVLMFTPMEGVFSLINEAKLFEHAWAKGIMIVGPTSLFATLRIIDGIWRVEKQTKNVEEIARVGGALHDKFVGFLEDMEQIGQQVQKTQKTHEEAMKKLSTGKGNLINQVDRLRDLGATAKKKLNVSEDLSSSSFLH